MSENPYEAPAYAPPSGTWPVEADAAPPQTGLGAFVLTFVIMDLVFCCLRLLMTAIGAIGYSQMPVDHPLHATAFFEVVNNGAIGLVGVPANVLLLLRKRIGIPLATATILVTTVGILIAGWQAIRLMPASADSPAFIAAASVGGIVMVVRIALLVFYSLAVVQARRRIPARAAATEPGW